MEMDPVLLYMLSHCNHAVGGNPNCGSKGPSSQPT